MLSAHDALHSYCVNISDHKHIHKWGALTLSEAHVHAGEEQEEEQGLELHGQFWLLCGVKLKKKRFNHSWSKQNFSGRNFTRFPASYLDDWERILVRKSSDLVSSCDYFIWSSKVSFPAQHIRFGKASRGIFNMQKKPTCCHSGPPKSQDDLLSVQLVVPQYSYVPIKSALPPTSTPPLLLPWHVNRSFITTV